MTKSFCSGCKHWLYIQASESNGKGFHYCDIYSKWELKWRKLWCNGKLKEQIEQAVQEAFLKSGIDKESFRQGIEWADEHPINYDGKAMLHVLNKGAAIGRREMLDKACEWLKCNFNMPDDFECHFRKAMEEQQ